MSLALEVSNLTKFYGSFKALDSVSFQVEKGWVYGYLGPNGAGKTTTIRTMLGLLRPNQGEVHIDGVNPATNPIAAFQSLGYSPELPALQTFFTATQLLDFMGKMFGMTRQSRKERTKYLLEVVGLEDWGTTKIGKYSKGMIQRLAVALALISDPDFLVMDEPTIGMDPEATAHFRNLFAELAKNGKTIFISSHLLDEVQRICTHVGMINKGRIVFSGPIAKVLETFTGQWTIEAEVEKATSNITSALKKLSFVEDVIVDGNKLRVRLTEKKDYRGQVSSEIFKQKGILLSLDLHKITLEDAYLAALRGARKE
jgi:ABC-2 type transport system ATP-binding protein